MKMRPVLSVAFLMAAACGAICPNTYAQVPCRYEVSVILPQAPPCAGSPPELSPTIAYAVSPNGRYVCGVYFPCTLGANRAFVYDTTTGVFTTIPVEASVFTSAEDVNDAGQVAGSAGVKGFVYETTTGQVTLLPHINPNGICTV